ncbi:hypothetical protein [Flavobacterium poyangense]|uniref:hypothetical protein n=1 Tax=Flavobacterium poyangense TaxID=2204302 RepID=UPI0014229BED|nr:hypothetical protein [Flavobacterium sp. JXAS1]
MPIQTLNTIKNWFKTNSKPTQKQFWDTWDSFRHKHEKVPVNEIEGIDDLLNSKADKTVLDEHLNDENAHAPQVNTDWNSSSGFSQLLNKPTFKTINGEAVIGDGDIVINNEPQGLKSVLDNNPIAAYPTDSHGYSNATIMGNYGNYKYNNITVGSESDSTSFFQLTNQISLSCRVLETGDTGTISLFRGDPQISKYKNGKSTIIKIADPITSTLFEFPAKPEIFNKHTYTIATTDDFKTVNGESIVGEGDIIINEKIGEAPVDGNQYGRQDGEWKPIAKATSPNLQEVLTQNKIAAFDGIAMQIEDTATNNQTTISGSTITMTGAPHNNTSTLYNVNGFQTIDKVNNSNFSSTKNGFFYFNNASKHNRLVFAEPGDSNSTIILPAKSGTIATTDEVKAPVSATQIGVVDNTPLQELGGVDKLINGVRIGKGSGTVDAVGNTALGNLVLSNNTTGTFNTGAGWNALTANTTGTQNLGLGASALSSNVSGNYNLAIGALASAYTTTGSQNTTIGAAAGGGVGSNFKRSIAIGYKSLGGAANTGDLNIAIGHQIGGNLTTGSRNVLIGNSSNSTTANNLTTGNDNVIIVTAGITAVGITTGSGNVAIGKITGLDPALSNTIVLADGAGNRAIVKKTNGEIQAPNLTNELIESGGNTSLITKQYFDSIVPKVVNDLSTSPVSLEYLNSTYPLFPIGSRVQCLSIDTGAMIYEKTNSGWVSHAINWVA